LIYILVVVPGGLFYLLNETSVENQTILLIFGQILPFFLIPLGPFAFGDSFCLKCKLLDESEGDPKKVSLINSADEETDSR